MIVLSFFRSSCRLLIYPLIHFSANFCVKVSLIFDTSSYPLPSMTNHSQLQYTQSVRLILKFHEDKTWVLGPFLCAVWHPLLHGVNIHTCFRVNLVEKGAVNHMI